MPGNSFSQERSTYGCTCSSSQTSPALYSLGVTALSIPGSARARTPSPSRTPCTRWRPPSGPHVEADGRSLEPEPLPQLIDQEPLVREMEIRGDVGEEHE